MLDSIFRSALGRAIGDLTAFECSLTGTRKVLGAELTRLEAQPLEDRAKSTFQIIALQQDLRRLAQTHLELVNFRGILRARLNECDPDLIAGMASAPERAPQGSAGRSQGGEPESEAQAEHLDA